MRTANEMALTLADVLDDATLVELQEMLDTFDLDFFEAVSAIVEIRHPELFATPGEVVEKPRPIGESPACHAAALRDGARKFTKTTHLSRARGPRGLARG